MELPACQSSRLTFRQGSLLSSCQRFLLNGMGLKGTGRHLAVVLLTPWLLWSCQPAEEQASEEKPVRVIYSDHYHRYQPWKQLDELFHDVQMQRVFNDSKTFVDSRPRSNPAMILWRYRSAKDDPEFSLKPFVENNFHVPRNTHESFETDAALGMLEHLESHWSYLLREPDEQQGISTLIPLPYDYAVPGGRFREMYYWDSYFTMRGLAVSGHEDTVYAILENFAWMLDRFGHIPNGNRTYYLSRSQPPFFAAMVSLLRELKGDEAAAEFLPQLKKEHAYWMQGGEMLSSGETHRRAVRMPDGSLLNRYWDDRAEPRPESYREDIRTAEAVTEQEQVRVYRDIRAAAESGWDFSSRWLADDQSLASIETSQLVPVDLNSLLYHLERVISELSAVVGDTGASAAFADKAAARRAAINHWLWDGSRGIYADWQLTEQQFSRTASLAMVYPLYFHIAADQQAAAISRHLKQNFLMPGGLVTTLNNTGEQWDYPNGWAPLQWLAVKGLEHYGHQSLATDVAKRWLSLNRKVFQDTGQMMEKYNVVDTSLPAGGGEYPLQDGFGWTNGVALALAELLEE